MKKTAVTRSPIHRVEFTNVTQSNSFANRCSAASPVNVADVMYRLGAAHEVFVQAMAVAR